MGVGQVLVSGSEYQIDHRIGGLCSPPQAVDRLIEIALTAKSKRQSSHGDK
jgi:hypothetical protein